jgi:hypothetical protein
MSVGATVRFLNPIRETRIIGEIVALTPENCDAQNRAQPRTGRRCDRQAGVRRALPDRLGWRPMSNGRQMSVLSVERFISFWRGKGWSLV